MEARTATAEQWQARTVPGGTAVRSVWRVEGEGGAVRGYRLVVTERAGGHVTTTCWEADDVGEPVSGEPLMVVAQGIPASEAMRRLGYRVVPG